ncbi:Stigma-specific STIG1-like protein [Drosera capensis]
MKEAMLYFTKALGKYQVLTMMSHFETRVATATKLKHSNVMCMVSFLLLLTTVVVVEGCEQEHTTSSRFIRRSTLASAPPPPPPRHHGCKTKPSICGKTKTCCGNNCIDLTMNSENCRACGKVCPVGTKCCSSTCVNTDFDPNNCGGCGEKCDAGKACMFGMCDYDVDLPPMDNRINITNTPSKT